MIWSNALHFCPLQFVEECRHRVLGALVAFTSSYITPPPTTCSTVEQHIVLHRVALQHTLRCGALYRANEGVNKDKLDCAVSPSQVHESGGIERVLVHASARAPLLSCEDCSLKTVVVQPTELPPSTYLEQGKKLLSTMCVMLIERRLGEREKERKAERLATLPPYTNSFVRTHRNVCHLISVS
ncbi:hypothetical protein TcWFU_005209 [Taenia crassiceps]|uniref:Uncharacterized protein n=1 Tax=Taenia crassiceps TaxID=6207 RepID=A0ABR4QFL5_9CEST